MAVKRRKHTRDTPQGTRDGGISKLSQPLAAFAPYLVQIAIRAQQVVSASTWTRSPDSRGVPLFDLLPGVGFPHHLERAVLGRDVGETQLLAIERPPGGDLVDPVGHLDAVTECRVRALEPDLTVGTSRIVTVSASIIMLNSMG